MNIIVAIKQYLAYRRQAQELRTLTDRELADIGISRDDIYLAVQGKL
jgi:uncharacterized protein YjiS (DUF1127 family)